MSIHLKAWKQFDWAKIERKYCIQRHCSVEFRSICDNCIDSEREKKSSKTGRLVVCFSQLLFARSIEFSVLLLYCEMLSNQKQKLIRTRELSPFRLREKAFASTSRHKGFDCSRIISLMCSFYGHRCARLKDWHLLLPSLLFSLSDVLVWMGILGKNLVYVLNGWVVC